MLHDKFLYDRKTGEWTPDRYLQDLNSRYPAKRNTLNLENLCRYGGIDSVLLWQGYPNLGLDDRSQFQLLESVPGGLEGLRGFIAGLQEGGVRVLLPYLPWDQGTSGQGDDIATLISQVKG